MDDVSLFPHTERSMTPKYQEYKCSHLVLLSFGVQLGCRLVSSCGPYITYTFRAFLPTYVCATMISYVK